MGTSTIPEKIIPASYRHECDRCGMVSGSSQEQPPDEWSKLSLRLATKYADGSLSRLLCTSCTNCMIEIIKTNFTAK